MLILAIGDVVGESGLRMVSSHLTMLRRTYHVDFTVINGENADMTGIRPEQAERLLLAGADVVTLGNHTWRKRDIIPLLKREPRVLRPANFPSVAPGSGFVLTHTQSGVPVLVISLVGRCLMDFHNDDPLKKADEILAKQDARVVIVDMHAEATSEKAALAYHLDGRVSAVFGTHTHVQTADEQVLPRGTGFLSDVGMTGPYRDSVLGVKAEQSVASFLGHPPVRYEPAPGPGKLEGAFFEIDENTGTCLKVERLSIRD